jgi:hypothetical protein
MPILAWRSPPSSPAIRASKAGIWLQGDSLHDIQYQFERSHPLWVRSTFQTDHVVGVIWTAPYTATQEQPGLKFEPTKAPDDVIVIDLVEMPSANKWPRATNVHTVSEWKNCGVS